jgi:hypothetical protein
LYSSQISQIEHGVQSNYLFLMKIHDWSQCLNFFTTILQFLRDELTRENFASSIISFLSKLFPSSKYRSFPRYDKFINSFKSNLRPKTIVESPKEVIPVDRDARLECWNNIIHSKEFAQGIQSLWVHQLILSQQYEDLVTVSSSKELHDLYSNLTVVLTKILSVRYFAKNRLGKDVNVGKDPDGTSVDVLIQKSHGKLYVALDSEFSAPEQSIVLFLVFD